MPDEDFAKLRDLGIDLEAASGQRHHLLPVPAVFLLGSDGVIRYRYANPDYRVRLDPAVLVEEARKGIAARVPD